MTVFEKQLVGAILKFQALCKLDSEGIPITCIMEDDGMATLIVAMVLMGMATFALGMLLGMCLMPMPWQRLEA